ncbi:Actin-related protein 2 [Camellia lanceoleosa]|uniref:Actin-related protein 2 n=1 Tax=Camellia lanceoleosa TaxID=1840588 RepID=A0ACC0F7V9_9ERIC|nr:Actin-related protein 2 [Camellia lanceoleosa]
MAFALKLLLRKHFKNSTADFETVRDIKENLCCLSYDYNREYQLGLETTILVKNYSRITGRYIPLLVEFGRVLCFGGEQFFWGVAFAVGAALQFLYIISIMDRLPFTMWVLQGAVKMVWSLPEVMRVACTFMLVMLLWLALWSFGAAGVVASSMGDGGRWWLLVVFSLSLFWTSAVL